jgi:hypothetical protein
VTAGGRRRTDEFAAGVTSGRVELPPHGRNLMIDLEPVTSTLAGLVRGADRLLGLAGRNPAWSGGGAGE